MAGIRLHGLTKSYGSHVAVNGVDLTVDDGEFIVLLGASGCGKSTILRMIAGLEKISGGEIWIGEEVVNDEPPSRRNVGMVFQNYALYPHMTVAGNLGFGLASRHRGRARRAARQDDRRQIRETADLLEISHVLSHRPKELSGGQRQRVALGRAIIRRPDIFLMDEPLSNLDANLRERMRLELARLHDKLRITTIYVTHDQGEALTLADRIVVLHDGRVHQVGTADDVYDRPADTYVARFLGSPGMNLYTLAGRIEDDIVLADGALRLPADSLPSGAGAGRPLTIGIRPEHLVLASKPGAGHAALRCRVDVVERLGSHLLVHGSFGDGQTVIARLDARTRLRHGDQIVLTASASHVHFFDPDSGERRAAEPSGQLAGAQT